MNDNSESIEVLMQQLLVELKKINRAMAYTEKKATRQEEINKAKERVKMDVILNSRNIAS